MTYFGLTKLKNHLSHCSSFFCAVSFPSRYFLHRHSYCCHSSVFVDVVNGDALAFTDAFNFVNFWDLMHDAYYDMCALCSVHLPTMLRFFYSVAFHWIFHFVFVIRKFFTLIKINIYAAYSIAFHERFHTFDVYMGFANVLIQSDLVQIL